MARRPNANEVPWPQPQFTPTLPRDFAMEVLKKEIELDKTPSLPLLQEVIQLYGRAIEFYEHKKDPRFAKFQERMHQLLLKPQIFHLMNTPATPVARMNPRKKFATAGPAYKTRDRTKTLKCMVDRHQTSNKTMSKQAVRDLASQEATLNRRMNQRKAASVNNSFNGSTFDTGSCGNVSFEELLDADDCVDDFQIDLEKALEEHYSTETSQIVEITTEYKLRMAQLGDSAEETAQRNALDVEMKRAIELFKLESNNKRKQVLKQVRSKYTLH